MAEQAMGILYYRRHFMLLACVSAALAASGRWTPAFGAVTACGLYGALHASAVVITLRAPTPVRRKLLFVAGGALLSMLSVTVSLYASRLDATLPGMAKPALLLTLSSGGGGAGYGILIGRLLGADLKPPALWSISLGCVAATLAVLASGIYLRYGGWWFAVAWWFAFSIGLRCHDGRAARAA
ncbi:MAG: hypothetical protein ABSH33_06435 [Steroidobacteraceae bacterium]|jgi:hypothetical protein